MSRHNKGEFPYKSLGVRLKSIREKQQETIAEVSGAVEIDVDSLARIEQGLDRPSEDILLLLISHFGVKEDEVSSLWQLAQFDDRQLPIDVLSNEDDGDPKPSAMIMPNDVRVTYTDMVHVVVNKYGVVMNFLQESGPNNQPMIVSRVGMSREHARSVLEVLSQTLDKSELKFIKSSNPSDPNTKGNN